MKYTKEIIINLPVKTVVKLFDNPDNRYKWIPGLEKMELVSGDKGESGSKTKLTFKTRNRTVEMHETIIDKSLPELLSAKYDAKGVENWVYNYFKPGENNTTRWITENEFVFSGIMKLMSFIIRGAFPKQTYKNMELFKAFAEENANAKK